MHGRIIVFLTAALLALALNAAHGPADNAQKPAEAERQQTQEELLKSLRYDEKPFSHWEAVLKTEIKPAHRIEAFEAMGEFGRCGLGKPALRVIFAAIQPSSYHKDYRIDAAAYLALEHCGEDAVQYLLGRVKSTKATVRECAFECLVNMKSMAGSSGPQLMPLFAAADQDLAVEAMHYAVRIEGLENTEAFQDAAAKAYQLGGTKRRVAALRAIHWCKNPKAFRILVSAASDADPEIRRAAMEYVTDYYAPADRQVPALARLLGSEYEDVRQMALDRMQKVVAPLLESLEPPELQKPEGKAKGGYPFIPGSRDLSEPKAYRQRLRDNAATAMPFLIAILKRGTAGTEAAVKVVAVLGPKAADALPQLAKLTKHRDPAVAAWAKVAAERVTGPAKED